MDFQIKILKIVFWINFKLNSTKSKKTRKFQKMETRRIAKNDYCIQECKIEGWIEELM